MIYDPEPEIKRYLARLSSAAHDLPKARRRELLAEIEQHIRQTLAEEPCTNQAEMLTLLDQVGDPAEIAAAATDQPEASSRSTGWELATILLLLLGGFVFVVGWLVGVMLLWSSSVWTLRDKLIGTFVIPGGLAAGVVLIQLVLTGAWGSGSTCSAIVRSNGQVGSTCSGGGASTLAVIGIAAGLALTLVAPLATAIYLKRRLNTQKHRQIGNPSAAIG